ncbi:unnamed protein product [Nesidiocoris tenuis]|uniref:Uncharacterized protein n=1 Tax=Nesidiocoris tenuis TaxID=355587 RepID=A0A6H5GQI3_9HEMI|nr:unnamed protein product [Nesidiocoris tenuis]
MAQNLMIEHYRTLALRTYLLRLKEPVGSQLRTRQPKSLNEVLLWLQNDYQTADNKQKPQFKPPAKPIPFTNFQRFQPPVHHNPQYNHRPVGPPPRASAPTFVVHRPDNPSANFNKTTKPPPRQETRPPPTSGIRNNPFQNRNQSHNFQNRNPTSGFYQQRPMSWQSVNPNLNAIEFHQGEGAQEFDYPEPEPTDQDQDNKIYENSNFENVDPNYFLAEGSDATEDE